MIEPDSNEESGFFQRLCDLLACIGLSLHAASRSRMISSVMTERCAMSESAHASVSATRMSCGTDRPGILIARGDGIDFIA